jgi:hypothetical protein
MESSGRQTDQLIKAAQIQACAATRNAESAKSMADSAGIQAVEAGKQAQAARDYAITFEKEIALQGATSREAFPADIFLSNTTLIYLRQTKNFEVHIRIRNSGKGKADSVSIAANLDFLSSSPSKKRRQFASSDFQKFDSSLLPITATGGELGQAYIFPLKIPSKKFATYEGDTTTKLYLWVEVHYVQFTTPLTAKFCRSALAQNAMKVASRTTDGYYAYDDKLQEKCEKETNSE